MLSPAAFADFLPPDYASSLSSRLPISFRRLSLLFITIAFAGCRDAMLHDADFIADDFSPLLYADELFARFHVSFQISFRLIFSCRPAAAEIASSPIFF